MTRAHPGRRALARTRVAAVAVLGCVLACAARGEGVLPAGDDEPPADAPEGEDFVSERNDSLRGGEVELDVGLDGHGDHAERRRRIRFRDAGLRGDWRSGDGDPLAGGALGGAVAGGQLTLGRASPGWGRGLMLGRSADPWRAARRDADGVLADGAGARALDGAGYRIGGPVRLELLAGRMARERLAAARLGAGPVSVGVLQRPRRTSLASLGIARRRAALEVAGATDRHWRAEGAVSGHAAALEWTARARAGSPAFDPPGAADPGPPQALALELASPAHATRWSTIGAVWRVREGSSGGRLALEVSREMAHHAVLALGAEEQHGVRRASASDDPGMRQAGWVEWHVASGPLRLGLRQETWGRRAFAREAVRSVAGSWVSLVSRSGLTLSLARTEFRVARGERLYLAEVGSDRLWLRALDGAGAHSRLEAECPLFQGRVRATLTQIEASGRANRPQWTIDWTRRARARTAEP